MADRSAPVACRPRSDLEKYQNEFARYIKRIPRCAGWMEMGSGKTAATLTAIVDVFNRLDCAKVLVVAPLRVAMKTWPDEIAAWEHTRHLRYYFLEGTVKQMTRRIQENIDKYDVFGISCDSVHTLAKIYLGRRGPFDWIVIDEASRFKNGSSKRSMAMKLVTLHPERVTELTGTPAPNGLKDTVAQIYMLDRGLRLGATMAEWKRRFCQTASGMPGNVPSKEGRIRIMNAVKDITYVLRPEDFSDVKRAKMNYIKLDLGEKLQAEYKRFAKDYILGLPTGEALKAVNAAGLGKKLQQFSSGSIYDSERNVHHIHDIKIEALKDIIEDNSGKPVLVVYGFRHEIPRMQKAFPQAEVFGKDPTQQDRWNRGEIPVLLASAKSVGHGLNLQFGGHVLVWFSFDYNLEEYQQTNKRLARKGQKNQVMIHHLVMSGTVDDMVINALRSKDNAQTSFQEDLQQLIRALLVELATEMDEV